MVPQVGASPLPDTTFFSSSALAGPPHHPNQPLDPSHHTLEALTVSCLVDTPLSSAVRFMARRVSKSGASMNTT